MTVRSPFTHEGHELATLLTVQAQLYETIKFLEADKRVQDKIIAARDAEIERLRDLLSMARPFVEDMVGIASAARPTLQAIDKVVEEWPTSIREYVDRQE